MDDAVHPELLDKQRMAPFAVVDHRASLRHVRHQGVPDLGEGWLSESVHYESGALPIRCREDAVHVSR